VAVDGEESIWIEALRLRIDVGVVCEMPYVREEHGSFRDPVAFDDVVFGAAVRESHGGDRVPAEDFFDDCVDVGELVAVAGCWEAVRAYYAVDLGLGFLLDGGVYGHC